MKRIALFDVGFMVLCVVFLFVGLACLAWSFFMSVIGVEPISFRVVAMMSLVVSVAFYVIATGLRILLLRKYPEFEGITRLWILERVLERLLRVDGL